MSQIPPFPSSVPPVPQSSKLSGTAVASLVCGLAGCLPGLTSLAAIVLGFMGMRASSRPNIRGRGLAIAGIILGVLGLLGWAGFGSTMYGIYKASELPRQEAESFLRDLADGNQAAALARCERSIPAETVPALAKRAAGYGKFKDLSLPERNASVSGGVTTWELNGQAIFEKTSRPITFVIIRRPDGTYRIESVKMRD